MINVLRSDRRLRAESGDKTRLCQHEPAPKLQRHCVTQSRSSDAKQRRKERLNLSRVGRMKSQDPMISKIMREM